MSESGGAEPTGRPGRYSRSASGLIGSMVVVVVIVVAFVLFRSVFSADVDATDREPVDYLDSVQQLQLSGFTVAYPARLPDGWIATDIDVDRVERPGSQPGIDLDLLTGSEKFVGVRQSDDDVDDLLESSGLDEPAEDDELQVDAEAGSGEAGGGLPTTWQGWRDEDGDDHAYSAVVGETVVLVYGSASVDDLATVVRSLTTAPVGDTPGVSPSAPSSASS
ncbi:DUF4245 family protein [Nocardioides marinquilinus]|uniref:DUF4245 family protein n=1 Tax=Nocardioides marinquilinus TaxID=1210400 RepID=UPI0031E8930C